MSESDAIKELSKTLLTNTGKTIDEQNREFYLKNQQQANVTPAAKFPLVSSIELTASPALLTWLIRGYSQTGELNEIFGPPESAKSLIALDMAFCVSTGIRWNGNDTNKADVFYIAGEGMLGMSKRLKGLEIKYDMQAPGLMLARRAVAIIDTLDAKLLADTIKQESNGASVIFIDTLNRNFGQGDENSTADMTIFISNVTNLLMSAGNVTVVIVHHSGHSNKERSRGNSALFGAVDNEYRCTKKDTTITLSCTKSKDIEKPNPVSFNIVSQKLPPEWVDDYGDPYTAPILESTEFIKDQQSVKVNHKEKMLMKSLSESIDIYGTEATAQMKGKFGGMQSKKVVDMSHWQKAAIPLLTYSGDDDNPAKIKDAKRKSFNRYRDALLNKGKIATFDNQYWIIT